MGDGGTPITDNLHMASRKAFALLSLISCCFCFTIRLMVAGEIPASCASTDCLSPVALKNVQISLVIFFMALILRYRNNERNFIFFGVIALSQKI